MTGSTAGHALPTFPTTRYQGAKTKLIGRISEILRAVPAESFLDLFGGTGVVSYAMKQAGKQVIYNDQLRFNCLCATGILENEHTTLDDADVAFLLDRHATIPYPTFVADTFSGIYFTDEENAWIDQTITNLRQLAHPHKQALAFFALAQACLVKRPFNLFHRKNLYVRLAQVERSFGNKASWDKPFSDWFRIFVAQANQAVIRAAAPAEVLCGDALDCHARADLVYIDPPYCPRAGPPTDYLGFYHFLEGLATYDTWPERVDLASKHRRIREQARSPWRDRAALLPAFSRLFSAHQRATIAVSYRGDGHPTPGEIADALRAVKPHVTVFPLGAYRYALSTKQGTSEVLILGEETGRR